MIFYVYSIFYSNVVILSGGSSVEGIVVILMDGVSVEEEVVVIYGGWIVVETEQSPQIVMVTNASTFL